MKGREQGERKRERKEGDMRGRPRDERVKTVKKKNTGKARMEITA